MSQTSVELIECEVVNLFGERSRRYIHEDVFQLWQYMMYHRHGFLVERPKSCVWTDTRPAPTEPVVPVNRVQIKRWDGALQKEQATERFVSIDDTSKVCELLKKHYDPANLDGHPLELRIDPGFILYTK
ncbi:hypothetical protein [Balneatrix alpica]|uniref:Uncharacterized protein n=1 Tax=Balneatrix alpica TaxID=75684 RepID=A0ABV5ZBP7_9GAMM|nr:hypothetical protein [Balneatrix alpica]